MIVDIIALAAVIILVLLVVLVYIAPLSQPSNPFPLASFPWHQTRVIEVLDSLGAPASLNVLEVGTGYGGLSRKCSLASTVKKYDGIELSWPLYLYTAFRRNMLSAAQQAKLHYRQGDALKMTMSGYDVIVIYTCVAFNRILEKKLRAENNPKGWTVISIVFEFEGLTPEKVIKDKLGSVYVYKI
jgi:hypothetical protein